MASNSISFGSAAGGPGSPADVTQVNDDELVAYGLVAEPVFTGMRALIGQLAGILLLAQGRRWRDVPDQPDLAAARERRKEVADHLLAIAAPEERQADLRSLHEAMACVDKAIAAIDEMRPSQIDEVVAAASTHLKAAYRLMQSACDHRIGLAMVDTSGSCCSCGVKLA